MAQAEFIRRRLDLRGQVQGVGFRPYVYRLACELGLAGYVANDSNGAVVEVEGPRARLSDFERNLISRLPPLAHIAELRTHDLEVHGETAFRIETSDGAGESCPQVTPDAAMCADCLRELTDPTDRRSGYAFINCTNCGPRYSIIRTVPYDRPATTMSVFEFCPDCAREYNDPADRRFHAQPNACPKCGPRLRLVSPVHDPNGVVRSLPVEGDPIEQAAAILRSGKIVAVKGIGGFHLACRADCEATVRRLRERKLRDGKPLAVMVRDIAAARKICRLTPIEIAALQSAASPIVLAPRAPQNGLAESVAPGSRDFGVLLAYAPVHHLLFAHDLPPLVMTSGNLGGQPLTYDDAAALQELAAVADAFLVHNREIFRPIDDSVVFVFRGETIPIRRARGMAPLPVRIESFRECGQRLEAASKDEESEQRSLVGARVVGGGNGSRVLALGGELKSTVCLLNCNEATLSEHLGDLTRPETYRHFTRSVQRLCELLEFRPQVVAHDLHPRYLSTQFAQGLGLPTVAVQHHHAHIASVMAERNEVGPVVGLSCDGLGFGTDGAVWGGEVLLCRAGEFERIGHLEYFPLVGGDRAAIETWRPAAALLRSVFGEEWCREAGFAFRGVSAEDVATFDQQVRKGVNTHATSSLGRVFDAVAFLLGLCSRNRHEAEAAMALESAAIDDSVAQYPFDVREQDGRFSLSVQSMVAAIAGAVRGRQPAGLIAARFHETIAQMLAQAAEMACESLAVRTVALSGGCFANRRLLARVTDLLERGRLRVLYNRQVPAGDGGLSLGQAYVAAWRASGVRLERPCDTGVCQCV